MCYVMEKIGLCMYYIYRDEPTNWWMGVTHFGRVESSHFYIWHSKPKVMLYSVCDYICIVA